MIIDDHIIYSVEPFKFQNIQVLALAQKNVDLHIQLDMHLLLIKNSLLYLFTCDPVL